MRIGAIASLAFAIVLASCTGPAGRVNVLQGDAAIVAGSTVAWSPLEQNELQNGDPRIDNDIIRQRIRAGVENALISRGFSFVQDPNAARYLVSYHIGLEDRQDLRVDSPPRSAVCGWRGCVSGFGWGMYGPPASVRTVDYTAGTLILDLTDRASGQLAWRATSQRRVDERAGTPERINAALTDMTRSLP
ncbi:MAG: DUF4136 domain-containing protein [Vitreimonas sp.]